MPGKLTFTIVQGSEQNKTFVFEAHDTLLLGRADDCHIRLASDDTRVSRHHFLLEVNPPDACLRDLGSLNGTWVNGIKSGARNPGETPEEGARRQFPSVDLHDGDEIRAGNTVLRLRVELPPVPPASVCCQRCGKDVAAEAGPGWSGDYICTACRAQVEADPSAMLAALFAPAPRLSPGAINLPDYDFERKLGEGGMGAVYLVRHRQTGQRSALKVMLARVPVDNVAQQRFLREADVIRSLQHPHIVEFHDSGAVGGVFYFLMEYCAGGSMGELMRQRNGRLALAEAAPIMLQALDGLAFAHANHFVHRDLKPQNILLAGTEGRWVAKLADLGMAKNFEQAGYSGMTATGSYGGSYPFMPREQIINFKYVQPASDVWSMAATFYVMLTGQFPYDFRRGRDPIEVILNDAVVPVRKRDARLPANVAAVIDRALAREAKDRYPDGGALRQALAQVL